MHRQTRQERAENMKTDRDKKVLEAAIVEAREQGYQWITREAVAQRAGVSVGGVNNAFGTMVELKRAVMREAIQRPVLEIVAQGLAEGSPIAKDAPPDVKQQALASLG